MTEQEIIALVNSVASDYAVEDIAEHYRDRGTAYYAINDYRDWLVTKIAQRGN